MLLRLLTLIACLQGLHSAHWSATLDHVIYACEGATVSLPWRYALDTGDTINQIEWYYNGASQEIIAIQAHGGFLAYPAFGNRVEQVNNAGLRLTHVITGDSGNYTVIINGYDSSGTHFELTQATIVHIGDQLMTQDGSVHVTVNPEAVLDTTADQWAIQLQCGHFTFVGNPPYSVEWTTPQGETRTSTGFTNGHFDLLLTNPVHGGNYTCRVPAQHLATSCLHVNGAGRGEASVFVDKVEARLTLLEKENQQLKIRAEAAETRVGQMQQQTERQLHETEQRLQQTEQLLQHTGQVHQTDQRMARLQGISATWVHFQAFSLANVDPPSQSPLIVNILHNNVGNAYNPSTGYFTAPFDGTYCFIGSSASATPNSSASLSLHVEDTQLDYDSTYSEGHQTYTSKLHVHGVGHVNAGQRVFLKSGFGPYHAFHTAFTGFLLSPDP